MDHKKKLEELHKEALEKFDEYLKAKGKIGQEHHEKIHDAKRNWQVAWSKMMEALMVLEKTGDIILLTLISIINIYWSFFM